MCSTTRRPKLVGLRCRSIQPTTAFCRVALLLHPTHDHVLSCCASAPSNPRPRSVGLRCRSTQPTTLDKFTAFRITSHLSWVQRLESETLRPVYGLAGQSLSGCAAAPPNLRPRSVGLRWRSIQPTTMFCRVALPLHPDCDHLLLGCTAASPNLRPRSVGLRCRSTRPTTLDKVIAFRKTNRKNWVQGHRSETLRPMHEPAGQGLSGCAGAPPNLRRLTNSQHSG